jgi:hypothetical protein
MLLDGPVAFMNVMTILSATFVAMIAMFIFLLLVTMVTEFQK